MGKRNSEASDAFRITNRMSTKIDQLVEGIELHTNISPEEAAVILAWYARVAIVAMSNSEYKIKGDDDSTETIPDIVLFDSFAKVLETLKLLLKKRPDLRIQSYGVTEDEWSQLKELKA